MSKQPVVVALVLSALVAAPSNAVADDSECVGVLTGAHDNVIVPPDAFCVLDAAIVSGSVMALENARLVVLQSDVRGNIDGDKAEIVQIVDSTIGGSVQIKEGETPNDGGFDVFLCNNILTDGNIQVEKMKGSIIIGDMAPPVAFECLPNHLMKGNIKVEENRPVPFPGFAASGLVIRGNLVAQNLQVFKNKGAAPKTVQNNIAGESVQCKENAPPFVGGPNAAPKKEGQCF